MNKLIAISVGDINGIGIKILIYLWKKNKINNFILVSNIKLLKKYLNKNKIKLPLKEYLPNNNSKIISKKFYVYNFKAKNYYQNTYLSLKYSYYLCSHNFCKGIITLPLNKNIINKKYDNKFIGQTEFFQKIEKKKYSNMIFYSKNLIILTLTTHIPIVKINNYIMKKNYIYNKIKLFNKTLTEDFNIEKPKIAISGLNPHAGENGLLGLEEIKYINPIIKKLKKENINIYGPFPGDTLFRKDNLKFYNSFICFYHDQALIPFKLLKGFNGINYTGSLDVIRISPDHGTGYGITNNKINNKSLLKCFQLIKTFINNRSKID